MLPGVAAQAEIFTVLTWGSLYLKSISNIKQVPEHTERGFTNSCGERGQGWTPLAFHSETKLWRRGWRDSP